MVLSDEQVAQRRRPMGWSGSEIAATPFLQPNNRGGGGAVSARKLAASLWRLADTTSGDGSVRWQCEFSFHDRLGFEFCSAVAIPKFATEGVTQLEEWDTATHFHSNVNLTSTACAKHAELFQTRKRVDELEEMASCMRAEHQKMCSVIKIIADGVERERRKCTKMDTVNSNLQRDIADAKLSAMRIIQNLEEEKKAREELENMYKDLAKEIQGNKAEIGALRNQLRKIQGEVEVEEERKMLQIAEVLREEQVLMKLADAKFILEEKCAHINNLATDLKALLGRVNLTGDVNVSSKPKGLSSFACRLPRSEYRFPIAKESQASETERRGDHCNISQDEANLGSQEASESSSALVMKLKNTALSTCETDKQIMINGISGGSKSSTESMDSPKGESSGMKRDVVRNPHVVRGMKGHVEWRRGITRHSLATNLHKTKFQSQKTRPNQRGN